MRKFHFSSICNVLPCELRLFWYWTRVLNRHLANKLPTCGQQSADSRPTAGRKGGKRQSADSRPTVGRLSADCRSTVGQLSADSFLGELFFTFSVKFVGFLCGLHEVYSHIMLRPNLFIYLFEYESREPVTWSSGSHLGCKRAFEYFCSGDRITS